MLKNLVNNFLLFVWTLKNNLKHIFVLKGVEKHHVFISILHLLVTKNELLGTKTIESTTLAF